MSNSVYPTLPGLMFPVQRSVVPPPVQVRTTPSQREYRARDATVPRYQYSLGYEFLRTGMRGNELATLLGFYNQAGGPFDSWLFTDPDDNTVTANAFGTGDGSTNAWQLLRSFGGFAEPVWDVAGSPLVYQNDWRGNVQMATWARSNLLAQSQAIDNAAWKKGGVTAPTGSNLAPDGTAGAEKVTESAAAGTHYVSQTSAASLPVTWVATFSVYLKAVERTQAQVRLNSGGAFATVKYALVDTSAGTVVSTSGLTNCVVTNAGGGWWRVVVTAATDSVGVVTVAVNLTNAGINTYTGDGSSGMLVWGAQLSAWPALTLVNASMAAGATTAPDSTTTAFKLTEAAVNNTHYAYQLATTQANAGQSITFSVYLKAAGRTAALVRILAGGAFATSAYVYVDISAGTLLAQVGVLAYSIVSAGSGWWKISITAAATAAGAVTVAVYPAIVTANTYLGDGSSGVYLWAAQIDTFAGAERYIPATSAAVTTTDIAVGSTGVVTFAVAPLAAAALTWSGSFYRRCRFVGDTLDTDAFMQDMYEAQAVKFISVKP